MGFQFSRPLAANFANHAKTPIAPAVTASHADANPANPIDPMDDRIRCTHCFQLSSKGICRAAGPKHKPLVANRGYQPVQDIPRRCEGFTPYGDNPNQRRGFERWPWLAKLHESDPSFGSNATPPGALGGNSMEINP